MSGGAAAGRTMIANVQRLSPANTMTASGREQLRGWEGNELTSKIRAGLTLPRLPNRQATEANAKEAVRALRLPAYDYFLGHHGAQTSSSPSPLLASFLGTLKDLLLSFHTPPIVRERVMGVLVAAAYASGSKKMLWRPVKPRGKPEDVMPFNAGTPCSIPPLMTGLAYDSNKHIAKAARVALASHHLTQRGHPPPLPGVQDRRRECDAAQRGARKRWRTLNSTTSQKLIFTQILWVSAHAERSRREGLVKEQEAQIQRRTPKSGANTLNSVNGNGISTDLGAPVLTREEELFPDLLAANEQLLGALQL
ncbi:hypothetical protein B0H19DRAFT_1076665 [Mycena capillaripes]|nr:hypothetical protein B0H19DRAFT_1076665 [Mycena capillaripes]